MAQTTYTVVEGDRWDTIAYKAYGVAGRFREIQEVNPFVPVRTEPVPGTVLIVPVEEVTVAEVSPSLPPWKQ